MPFWQFFRMGWDGHALLGRPSRIPHRNWKIIFVLGADEYIERLEGKIRECLFFYVKIFYNNSVDSPAQWQIWLSDSTGHLSLVLSAYLSMDLLYLDLLGSYGAFWNNKTPYLKQRAWNERQLCLLCVRPLCQV